MAESWRLPRRGGELKHLIVGLDPGTTTALCLLDFDGRVRLLISKKHFMVKDINDVITSFGRPSVIATDRAKAPSLAARVAASFGVGVFTPETDVDKRVKTLLASNRAFKNRHERDALAAATLALNSYRDVFERVDRRVLPEKREEMKDLLIRHRVHNIAEAVRGKVDA